MGKRRSTTMSNKQMLSMIDIQTMIDLDIALFTIDNIRKVKDEINIFLGNGLLYITKDDNTITYEYERDCALMFKASRDIEYFEDLSTKYGFDKYHEKKEIHANVIDLTVEKSDLLSSDKIKEEMQIIHTNILQRKLNLYR